MLKIIYFSLKTESKLYFFATLLFYFLFFKTIFCQEETCYDYSYLYENGESCFNFLKFDHKRYQSNNFAINKNGDLILELTEYNDEYDAITSSRLFYGLTKEGKYYFSNKSSYTHEYNIDINEETFDPLKFNKTYNSINLFVSMKNDPNQYLFSINQYNSIVELHNITNENNNFIVWNFNNFFNLNKDDYFFPYECSLFELKNESTYIIAFIPNFNVGEELSSVNFIKKFRFKSFDINTYEEIKTVQYINFLEHNIVNVFLMDDSDILVIVSNLEIDEENHNDKFILNFYTNELEVLTDIKDLGLKITMSEGESIESDDEIFLKSIYLGNNNLFFILYTNQYFLFYLDNIDYLNLKTTMIIFEQIYFSYYYDYYDSVSNLVKINDKKIAFFYTSRDVGSSGNSEDEENWKLVIFIINIYFDEINENSGWFGNNEYNINLEPFIPKMKISTYLYNGFLLFSSTFISQEDNENSDNNSNNYFSLFMIFGYPNGTDRIENISNYLSKDETCGNDYEFYDLLNKNKTIENNIFDYFELDVIKLISIPEEILIYRCRENNGEELINLENNPYIFDSSNILLKQNLNLTKTYNYYYIDYQYMAGEETSISPGPYDEDSFEDYLTQIYVYYGRINRLYFKLCHDYCETCNELGVSNDDQKCLSCLPMYQYDYWYFYNNTQEKCVPEGYYYDIETNSLIQCDPEKYIYYHNITDNKTICFKKEFGCPSSYPYLNETTNECFNNDSYNEMTNKISSIISENTDENETINESSKLNYNNVSETNIDGENYLQSDYSNTEKISISSSIINQIRNECLVCDYKCYRKGGCNFDNYNISEDVYNIIKSSFISDYNGEEGYLRISNGNNFIYQITTVKNELNSLYNNTKSDLSIIDLKGCSDLLKAQNGIDSSVDLIILKYENENSVSNGNEKSIQYEVYLPNSTIKLNLSVCSNININIYVPIKLNEQTQKLYDDLKEQGYNFFDKNDKFYKDICNPYKSENGTDVLLADRYNDFFVANQLTCQSNCEYSDYLPNSQYLKCECNVVDEEKIETKEPEKMTSKSIGKSFYNILKYSNYKVLFCYKLVFRNVILLKMLEVF